jgi:H/ACA ribonucleoprotein complex non-core subunit NAF1
MCDALPSKAAPNGGPLLSPQAPLDTRALAEGSVLVLQDRTPLGRIEDVFGPVKQPLYVLRYGGEGRAPPGATVGATVFAVDKFAEFVVPDKCVAKGLVRKGCGADVGTSAQ